MGAIGFYFFGHFIAYYGLMIVLGLAVTGCVSAFQLKQYHLDWNDFSILASIGGLFGVIGAKVLYFIVSFHSIDFHRLTDLLYLASLMRGGFVFLGGVIAAFPALLFCKYVLHISPTPYIQPCIGCLPIMHGFGRIGCFLVGCCYGIPYNGVCHVIYQRSLFAPNHIPLFPVQLMEAVFEIAIGFFLIFRSKKFPKYDALYFYLTYYALLRFLLEFFRGDKVRGFFGVLSTSQWITLALLLGLSVVFLYRKKYNTTSQR